MSYTPTTWTTGDTITATALNKIENGIANAGGAALLVHVTETWNGDQVTYTADKTAGEIINAMPLVFLVDEEDGTYQYTIISQYTIETDYYSFSFPQADLIASSLSDYPTHTGSSPK